MKQASGLLCLSTLAVIAALAKPAAGAAGDPDLSFGTPTKGVESGMVLTPFPNRTGVRCLAVQTDGKIIAAGFTGIDLDTDFAAVRYLPDGTLDTDFGTTGRLVTDVAGGYVSCVAQQPDGKILLAGMGDWGDGFPPVAVICRYLSGGTLDPSFGRAGRISFGDTNMDGHWDVCAMTVLDDGKILVAAETTSAFYGVGTLISRFNPDGSFDAGFGGGGQLTLPGIEGTDMVVQSDGKFVIAGYGSDGTGGGLQLVRCDAGGTPDPAFGSHGSVTTATPVDGAPKLALQSDGKIVVSGTIHAINDFFPEENYLFLVARYQPDGALDKTFGGTGMATADPTPVNSQFFQSEDLAIAVAVQGDGKILVAGTSIDGSWLLARFHRDGRLDTRFNGDGRMVIPVSPNLFELGAMVLQPDGKILLGGGGDFHNSPSMAVGRYLSTDDADAIAAEWPEGRVLNREDIVDAGSVIRGQVETREMTITLRNSGSTPLTALTASLSEAPHFAMTAAPASTLPAGGTTTVTVQFTSLPAVSSFDGNLVISGNHPGPVGTVIKVHGATVAPAATLALDLDGLPVARNDYVDFGPAAAAFPASRVFTIRNTGNIDLTVQSLSLGTEGTPGDFTVGLPAAAVLAASAVTTFPVTFSPGENEWSSAKLRVISTDTFGADYEINLIGSRATPLETWRQNYFGSPAWYGSGADLRDPDNDGIPNVLEYAMSTNPVVPNAPAGQLVKNGDTLVYTFTRPSIAAVDLRYSLEWNDHPQQWTWEKTAEPLTILSDDGTRQHVKFSVPAGDTGRRFVRLRVDRI